VSTTVTRKRRRLPGARTLRDGRHLYWWAEVLAILVFYAVYSAVRNSVSTNPDPPFQHAKELIEWERHLGIYHELTLQRWALHFRPLIIAMNYVYGSLHFAVTAGAGIYLYRTWSDDYPKWRNTLAITTGLALIGFYFWPLMPPRLLPAHYGFIDTLAKYPTIWSFNSGEVSKLSNQYAAMPSVHCAWALFCACVLVPRVKQRWAKILAAAYPALTVTAIVLTGNHYFLDAVGGFITLGIAYLAATQIEKIRQRLRPEVVDITESTATIPSEPWPQRRAGTA
jgi:membrane-associated phospholipid phosphatase